MSELEFDSHLPHLEQGGWQPGMYWVPTVEQQAELEIRAEAEAIADRTYEIQQLLGGDWEEPLTFDADHIPPQDSEEREKAVIGNIVFAKLERDYEDRPFDTILQHALKWVDEFHVDAPNRFAPRRAFEHEATALLRRRAEHPGESSFDPEIVDMAVRWAAIEHFMFHCWDGWSDDMSQDGSFKLIADAGIPEDELVALIDSPLNDEAEKDFEDDPTIPYVAYANQAVIEKRLLEWAKTNGVDISSVHTVAYQKFQLGI